MSQRHATDVVSLVFGTIFAGFTVVWALALALDTPSQAWWAGPLVLVIAGGAGLVASLRPERTASDAGQPFDPPAT